MAILVHLYSYLETQWEAGTSIELFRDTMGNRYTYKIIYRYNGKQVHIYKYLQVQCETGTHI